MVPRIIVLMVLVYMCVFTFSLFHSASVTSPPDAYFYADTHGLVWDKQLNCWTKDDLHVGGGGTSLTSTNHLSPSPSPSPSPDHRSTPTLPSYSSATSVDADGSTSTLRLATLEQSQYGGGYPTATGGGGGYARPLSQMSFSDDLQTILSQEVSVFFPSVLILVRYGSLVLIFL